MGDALSPASIRLDLCVRALKLIRGPILEFSAGAPWLEPHQTRWAQAFRALALDTLELMETLDEDRPAQLLALRAAAILPQDEALHSRLIDFLLARDRQPDLIRYPAHLSRRSGWLRSLSV